MQDDNSRIENKKPSVEELCNLGITLWKCGVRDKDTAMKSAGISRILDAYKAKNIEATAYVGYLLYIDELRINEGDSKTRGINLLHYSANRGSVFARTTLNRLCFERYTESRAKCSDSSISGPLTDFYGKIIKINKSGVLTPIDAVLEYKDGINWLNLSVNLLFADDTIPRFETFKAAVISGIKEWEGNYNVFGGQDLKVTVNITTENRLIDNVIVFPVSEETATIMRKVSETIINKKGKAAITELIDNNRSMTAMGLRKWSTRSRKIIIIKMPEGSFDDAYEIKHVAKHEFGHALGLGDLYANKADNLEGVEMGTYSELDGFYISDKMYNLVMSDHHGPISNNDIEMVVLAFSEDKAQLYQKDDRFKEGISQALGRGN